MKVHSEAALFAKNKRGLQAMPSAKEAKFNRAA